MQLSAKLRMRSSSTSELSKELEPRSMPEVKKYLDRLDEQYAQDLDALIDDQVDRYYEDALDRYHAYDPALVPPIDDPEDWPRDFKDNNHKFNVS